MDDVKLTHKASKTNQFLESDAWKEAWEAYRTRLLAEIEAAEGADTVMRLKGLLRAAKEARGHLEKIVNEGKFVAHQLELAEKRKKWRLLGL